MIYIVQRGQIPYICDRLWREYPHFDQVVDHEQLPCVRRTIQAACGTYAELSRLGDQVSPEELSAVHVVIFSDRKQDFERILGIPHAATENGDYFIHWAGDKTGSTFYLCGERPTDPWQVMTLKPRMKAATRAAPVPTLKELEAVVCGK